jgi:para-aminobenzoate synthetase / 4-amino-4-deoxychorismate lyase
MTPNPWPPPFDPRWPAFALGVAVFETVAVRGGVPWLLERHLARLERAAQALAPELALFDRAAIEAALWALLSAVQHPASVALGADGPGASPGECVLRINLGIGDGPLLYVTSRALPSLPPAGFTLWPAPAELAVAAEDPGAEHKHVGRFLKERAFRAARAAGCFDALLPSSQGGFACASRGNVYAHLEGGWWTPPLGAGALPGVVRGLLLEAGLVGERPLDRTHLAAADEVALSNALWLLWPVHSLRGERDLLPGTGGPRWRETAARLTALARPAP